jgi:hypothetical protein
MSYGSPGVGRLDTYQLLLPFCPLAAPNPRGMVNVVEVVSCDTVTE